MTNQTNGKDPLIHFPFYLNQYQGILSRYSLQEKGAFISLLCVYLLEDEDLPENFDQLCRMCLAFSEDEKSAIKLVKSHVIEIGKEILRNQRVKRQKCRQAASLGGSARVANAQANAKQTLKHSSSNTENREQIQRTDIETKKDIKPKRFIPPTLEEVTQYCQERKNSVNPNKWMNHYQSKGWKIGKETMKDWKAAIRTWEGNDYQQQKPQSSGSYLDTLLGGKK